MKVRLKVGMKNGFKAVMNDVFEVGLKDFFGIG